MEELRKRTYFPLILGAVIEAVLWIVIFVSYFHAADPTLSQLAFALVLSVAAGLIAVGLAARRLTVWLGTLLTGLFIGAASAVELIYSEPFEQEFFITAATLAYFVALGLAIGSLFEFIRLLHYIFHGGKIREYQRLTVDTKKVELDPKMLRY